MQSRNLLSVILLGFLLIFAFQNCGPGFKIDNRLGALDSSSIDTFGESLPNYVSGCLQSNYQACLVWKNPVAHQNSVLSPKYTTNLDINSWRLHGVEIKGFDQSGFLSNSTIDVMAGGRQAGSDGSLSNVPLLERVSTASGDFKFTNNNDPNFKLQQLSAFYWLQFQNDFMRERTGIFYASAKNTKVYTHNPDLNNAYFSVDSSGGIIVLGGNQGNAYAMHAEVITHEMGHANIHHATSGRIWNMQNSPNADVSCVANTTVTCCPTRDGCAKALNEGQADYHAALLFASRPAFGETWENRLAGLKTPAQDLFRDPTQNTNLTADEAYELSAVVNGQRIVINGEARSMAALYTSIWWELRKAATRATEGTTREMDELFSEHLAVLTGNDTIVTARDKILAIDRSMFESKYSTVIASEFSRRGY